MVQSLSHRINNGIINFDGINNYSTSFAITAATNNALGLAVGSIWIA
jgi:hypothetical protein